MGEHIYFLGILPPEEISKEVMDFKKHALEVFQSGHALKSPAHITLFPPFRWKSDQIDALEQSLKTCLQKQEPFFLSLHNFRCFSPRVIYIHVEKQAELISLQQKIELGLVRDLGLKNQSPHPFTPHMTVAYKDLKRPYFLPAWAHFSQIPYERIFLVKALTLLKHQGGVWDVFKTLPFGK